jgi:hypothetical protein
METIDILAAVETRRLRIEARFDHIAASQRLLADAIAEHAASIQVRLAALASERWSSA